MLDNCKLLLKNHFYGMVIRDTVRITAPPNPKMLTLYNMHSMHQEHEQVFTKEKKLEKAVNTIVEHIALFQPKMNMLDIVNQSKLIPKMVSNIASQRQQVSSLHDVINIFLQQEIVLCVQSASNQHRLI